MPRLPTKYYIQMVNNFLMFLCAQNDRSHRIRTNRNTQQQQITTNFIERKMTKNSRVPRTCACIFATIEAKHITHTQHAHFDNDNAPLDGVY